MEFQAKYEADGLVVLGVSMDESGWDAVQPLLAKMPVNYRIMLGNDAVAREFGGVNSLPSTFLIDRAGRVAVTREGVVDRTALEQQLHSLLTAR